MPDDELDELRRRLDNEEDALVERKPQVRESNIRPTVVAFANSLQADTTGILFLGVTDQGKPNGSLGDVDKAQRDVGGHVSGCFPPIPHRIRALRVDGVDVLAVVVMPSETKPHFSGRAYVRRNNETNDASDDMLDQLVAERLSLVHALTPHIEQTISLYEEQQLVAGVNSWSNKQPYTLKAVNSHYLRVRHKNARHDRSFALSRVTLEWDCEVSPERPLFRVRM